MYKRILLPLDGSTLAESVLPMSCALASGLEATLILFHVVEKHPPDDIHGEYHIQSIDEAYQYLERVGKQLTCSGIRTELDVHEVQEEGVAQTIRSHAQELHTDLIILCAHGSGGMRDLLFGNIAEQIIRQGSVPILLVKPGDTQMLSSGEIKQILLPLDGETSHEASIPPALSLAEILKAKVQLVTVIPTYDTGSVRDALTDRVAPRIANYSLEAAVKHAEDYLQEIGSRFTEHNIEVQGRVSRGDPASQLASIAQETGSDLIILATHGHSTFDARWQGSLTPRFLPKTHQPVLLILVK